MTIPGHGTAESDGAIEQLRQRAAGATDEGRITDVGRRAKAQTLEASGQLKPAPGELVGKHEGTSLTTSGHAAALDGGIVDGKGSA